MGGGAVRDSEVGEEGLWHGNRARTSSLPVFCNSSLELMTSSSKQKQTIFTLVPFIPWGVGHRARTARTKR